MNLHEDRDVYIEFIQAAADHLSMPAIYIEKDYWVTYVLLNLSRSDFIGQLIFKGGTSLSKAHKIISRFSEDVDLAAHVVGLSANKVKHYIREAESVIAAGLTYIPDRPGESKHGTIRKTWHKYPRLIEGDFAQASPDLLLEINAFTTPEPFTLMPVQTLIAESLCLMRRYDLVEKYGLAAFQVNVLNVERTVAEKIMSLVRASREQDSDAELKAKIRHIYDLCLIRRQENYSGIFEGEHLLSMLEIVEAADRQQFRGAGDWLDIAIHQATIFADAEQTWQKIRGEFHTRFAPLVYDGKLPEDEEVIGMLSAVHALLVNYTPPAQG